MEFELAEVRNQLEPFGVFAPLRVLGWILFLLKNFVKLCAVSPQHSDVVLLFQVPTFPIFSSAEVPTFLVSNPDCSPATIPGWVSWFHGHYRLSYICPLTICPGLHTQISSPKCSWQQ